MKFEVHQEWKFYEYLELGSAMLPIPWDNVTQICMGLALVFACVAFNNYLEDPVTAYLYIGLLVVVLVLWFLIYINIGKMIVYKLCLARFEYNDVTLYDTFIEAKTDLKTTLYFYDKFHKAYESPNFLYLMVQKGEILILQKNALDMYRSYLEDKVNIPFEKLYKD